jgi:hypothetical protein
MSGSPVYSAYPPPKPASKAPILIVVLAVVALLVYGLLGPTGPAFWAEREAGRRRRCQFNLKQIGLALLSYEQANGCFPPAVSTDNHGKRMMSWRVAILPYLEQHALFRQYNSKQPWDSPQNRALGNTALPLFRCPSDPDETANPTETNYVRIVGKDTVGGIPNEAVEISEITDGTHDTIMVVEVSGLNINWEEPRDVTVDEFMDIVSKRQASHHDEGFDVLMADGSANFLNYRCPTKVLRLMLMRNCDDAMKGGGVPW